MAAVLLAVSVTFSQQQGGRSAAAARYNQSGDRIVEYFDVQAADIRSVMRQLSAYGGVDIIVGDAVKATVSITVSNKSWREILAVIGTIHNLAVIDEKAFVYVMSREEAAARGMTQTASPEGGALVPSAQAGPSVPVEPPLIREVIPLKFTTAKEISPALGKFLSPRGKLTEIEHTNALIVVDTDENMKELRALIQQIDIQTPQISISCKIIEVNSGVIQRMGVHWGYNGAKSNIQVTQDAPEGMIAGGLHRLTFGVLSPKDLTAALEYLFEDTKAEIVAQPQITTLNNKKARVSMGQKVTVNRKDDANNTISEIVDVFTELVVTPYVSGGGKIMLGLEPKKSSFTFGPDNAPIINEQSAETNVLVNNGETVVIAGLTSNEKRDTEAGIPILKSIPIIGNLFKRSNKTREKRDLIIFVTPHIIHAGI